MLQVRPYMRVLPACSSADTCTTLSAVPDADQLHVADIGHIVPCGTGLGAGASGASAGLLHPYTPRGKLLWRGEECMEAALDLVAVAAAAAQTHRGAQRDDSPAEASAGPADEPFVWRQPILRPAVTAKQVRGTASRPGLIQCLDPEPVSRPCSGNVHSCQS